MLGKCTSHEALLGPCYAHGLLHRVSSCYECGQPAELGLIITRYNKVSGLRSILPCLLQGLCLPGQGLGVCVYGGGGQLSLGDRRGAALSNRRHAELLHIYSACNSSTSKFYPTLDIHHVFPCYLCQVVQGLPQNNYFISECYSRG